MVLIGSGHGGVVRHGGCGRNGGAERSSDATSRTGLRRVDWVRLIVDSRLDKSQPVRAEAIGVGFRLPVTCPIPLSLAADLIASGTPYVSHPVAYGE
jgi:hypothetical protein